MILFVAPNPHKVAEKEGFLQRVAAIDNLFSSHDKQYSDDLTDEVALASALIRADVIYVHSMYNANKIARSYPRFSHKIITDLHGVVPEEETYANNMEMARIMEATERTVFEHGINFVAVSHAMVDHFNTKYELKNTNWVVLPIFEGTEGKQSPKVVAGTKTVVYAGGDQSRQNVDMMVDAINTQYAKYQFSILTHHPEAFANISSEAASKVVVKKVPSTEISAYYQSATLGFILRSDSLVNKVACPTKLVEYLSHGVVPIVLSENIGDFKSLGYKYFSLDEFCNDELSDARINDAIVSNYKIFEKFAANIKNGRAKLVEVAESLVRQSKSQTQSASTDVVREEIEYQKAHNQLLKYEYQIETYKQKLTEYAEAVEYYRLQEELHEKPPVKEGGMIRTNIKKIIHK